MHCRNSDGADNSSIKLHSAYINTPTQISTPKYYAVYVVIASWKNPVAGEVDSSPSKI